MAVESMKRFVDALWNWDILGGCFTNPRVKVSDIDGTVELNSHFLYLECKGIGVAMPVGQAIAFERRAEDGRSTVIYVWGDRDRPEAYQVVGVMPRPEPCDTRSLRRLVKAWADWAAAQSRPPVHPPCWDGALGLRAHNPGARFSDN